MTLIFYNSLTRRLEEFQPLVPGQVGLYTCGPTVYNYAHIGNFRCYAFEDILKRTLQFLGYKTKHVMNLTDVDDKTIRGAREAGLKLGEFTQKFKQAFFADIATLRMLPADIYPAATEHLEEMIEIIKILFERGIAYQAEDRSVYFSIAKWPQYGQLVNIDRAQMRAGTRVKLDEYTKDSAADFALWKAWDEDDGEVYWDSPWGKGRPGWHLECSAMSSKYLGATFDMHCGGIDNIFPHHEDEIAQSEAANGCKFVNYWLHCAHLVVEGQKMSKSLGNFYTLAEILAKGYSGREVRWVLIGTHYRQSLNFSFQALHDARTSLQRIDAFRNRLQENLANPVGEIEAAATKIIDKTLENFAAALSDDLNISAAFAVLFEFIREMNRGLDSGWDGSKVAQMALDALTRLDSVLAVCVPDSESEVPAAILALAEERQAARKSKDYARADALRQEIESQGWLLEDTPKGPRVIKK
ncbi:MAG: cysteine--tRNA ligase [Candidatus Cloacimonadaceae bacterium]